VTDKVRNTKNQLAISIEGKTKMIKSEIQKLIYQYQTIGVMEAGELLLRPEDALQFVYELEKIGVELLGVDLWYQLGDSIVQDLSSMDLSSYAMNKENRLHEKTLAVERLIKHIPDNIVYLSFVWK